MKDVALRHDIREVLLSRSRLSSAGFPYLHPALWARLRDWVPVILDDGQHVLDLTAEIENELGPESKPNARVIRQVVNTAAVTAPSDLWLMRHIQSAMCKTGLAQKLLDGEVIFLAQSGFLQKEIEIDFRFLLTRGTLVRQGEGYRLADHDAARAFMSLPALDLVDVFSLWMHAFVELTGEELVLLQVSLIRVGSAEKERGFWHPSAFQIEMGSQIVPLVVALKAKGELPGIVSAGRFEDVFPDESINVLVRTLFKASGILDEKENLTEIGKRVLTRGPGPFGIIETYRQYLEKLEVIWAQGRDEIWVERSANVAASQTANRKSFTRAHDALEDFCKVTKFTFDTFIEHAVGKGEAIRQCAQRYDSQMSFVGADLEDKAIDAAEAERDAGELPASTKFVRNADIGEASTLLKGLKDLGIESEGSVMMVGNGFHEVRGKNDKQMIEVFSEYEAAGILLIFTEESALSIDDLIETAFNTYHAGFRYVHERSGQALRPGVAAASTIYEGTLPLSWSECAKAAGYVRAEKFCRSSRTVYPYTPPSGFNPTISSEHFFVPGRIAKKLGI